MQTRLPVYKAGTIAIASVSSVWTVTGVGTQFLAPDGINGWSLAEGDILICGNAFGIVDQITSATSMKLALWTGAAVGAGASYKVIRFEGLGTNGFAGTMQKLVELNAGPPGEPGEPGPPGAAGNTILPVSGTPASGYGVNGNYAYDPATFTFYGPKAAGAWPAGVVIKGPPGNTGPAGPGGLTNNKLKNPGFIVNQDAYASGVALAAGVYGHDMWKAGASGGSYSYAASGNSINAINILTGSILQIIEGMNISGGSHVISWTGTATCKLNGAAAAASPIVATLAAGTNVTLEFLPGTLSKPICEPGTVANAYVAREITQEEQLCERYYRIMPFNMNGSANTTGIGHSLQKDLRVRMRATPTVSIVGTPTAAGVVNTGTIAASYANDSVRLLFNSNGAGGYILDAIVKVDARL